MNATPKACPAFRQGPCEGTSPWSGGSGAPAAARPCGCRRHFGILGNNCRAETLRMAPGRSDNREKNDVTTRQRDAGTVAAWKGMPEPRPRHGPGGSCGFADKPFGPARALRDAWASRPQAPQDSNNNPFDMDLKGEKGFTECGSYEPRSMNLISLGRLTKPQHNSCTILEAQLFLLGGQEGRAGAPWSPGSWVTPARE